MNKQLTIKQLQVIYSDLQPLFQAIVVEDNMHKTAPVSAANAEIVSASDLNSAIQSRTQQDEEDKRKIRGALW